MARGHGRGGTQTADGAAVETVRVHGDDVRVDRVASEVPAVEARSRFGGVDLPAVAGGVLAALGAVVVLAAVLAGLGRLAHVAGLRDEQALSIAGLVAGLVALGAALWLGGWVTGRAARYDGGRNGLLTGVGFLLLAAALGAAGAAAGSQVEQVRDASLPTWLDRDTATVVGLAAAVAAVLLVLAAAVLGARRGARWHRGPDDALVLTRPGGLSRSETATARVVQPYPQEEDR